ncbi:MAG TPA: thioredoxin [Spirochaetia bacterium]|nr:thioredoxin [Spirochaetia bacterium]
MGAEVTVTQDNFDAEVLSSNVPVLVDFWADWCVPCRMVAPILEEIANAYAGKIKVAKINVDQAADLAAHYSISSIPTLMVFKDGNIVRTKVGAGSRQSIEDLFKDLI